jgi:anthranilate phosphoribosyltransferase
MDENLGVHDGIIETTHSININTDNLINIADPYDGFSRNLPSSIFLLPVLAELGYPIISHGVFAVGPKYGCTHHLTLKELNYNCENSHEEVAARLEDKNIGWAYADQSIFNPKLHDLMSLRKKIIKRPVITTVEVLVKPVSSKHDAFFTGFVHKPYPPIYLELSRNAGFHSASVIRGTEGGIIPSLRQMGKVHYYDTPSEDDKMYEVKPEDMQINNESRAVDIPDNIVRKDTKDKIESKVSAIDIAKATVKSGQEALSGKDGAMKSCIQLGASIILQRMTGDDIIECSKEVLKVIDSGSALKRMKS